MLDPVAHFLDPLKVHHFQCCQGRIRIGGIEESQLVTLFGGFVLGQLAECGLFGRGNGDVKDRLTAAQLHTANHLDRISPQLLAAELYKTVLARGASNAEHPFLVVELFHQINDEIALFGKSPIGTLQHIPG